MDPNENKVGGSFGHAPGSEPAGFSVAPVPVHQQPGEPGQPTAGPAQPGGQPAVPAGPYASSTAPGAAPAANPYPAAAAAPAGNPAVADDGDLIEKEWVNKAKSIVEKTRHDPYEQSLEISKLRADYLQKRYGKQLKVDD